MDLDDGDGERDGFTWAQVARKANAKARRKGGGKGLQEQADTADDAARRDAPRLPPLPPPRVLELPVAPRRTLVSKHAAQVDKIGRLESGGAKPAKLHRAQEQRQLLEREVRLAGGATDKALSLALKNEDELVEKALRALNKAREAKRARLDERDAIDRALLDDDVVIERYEQRHRAAVAKRAFLSTTKFVETATESTVTEFREVISQLGSADPAQAAAGKANAQVLLQFYLDRMAPPEVDVNIADGDTPTEGESVSDGTDLTDVDMHEADIDHQHCHRQGAEPSSGSGGRYERQLVEARAKLEKLANERRVALEGAEIRQACVNKRALDGHAAKSQEADGDEQMAAPLTPQQVKDLFKARLEEATEAVEHLSMLAASEEVRTIHGAAPGEGGRAEGAAHAIDGARRVHTARRSRPPSPQRHATAVQRADGGGNRRSAAGGGMEEDERRRPAVQRRSSAGELRATAELAEGAAIEMQRIREQADAINEEHSRAAEIRHQEWLQVQQETEAIESALAAKRAAVTAEKVMVAAAMVELDLEARARAERAPTPEAAPHRAAAVARWRGPTGTRLDGGAVARVASENVDMGRRIVRRIADEGREPVASRGRERSPRPRHGD